MEPVQSQQQEQAYQLQLQQDSRRLRANLNILDLLKEYFLENTEYRFGQGLYNLNIATHLACYDSDVGTYHKDIFFQESVDLCDRLAITLGRKADEEWNSANYNFIKESKSTAPKGFETPMGTEMVNNLEYLEERDKEETEQ